MKILQPVSILAFVLAFFGILVAPLFLNEGYSVLSNSISEAAAQNVPNGWIARAALFLSGLGVLLTVALRRRAWSRTVTYAFTLFGFLWIVTSFFSTKSWIPASTFNALENDLHSMAASSMSILVLGALAYGLSRKSTAPAERMFAFGLAAAATFLPLASLVFPDYSGVFQRLMFFYTYFWFARQAKLA